VGVHQDGLVHVSQLADRFVKDPSDVVKVGDKIKVRVMEVDMARKRIALSARKNDRPDTRQTPQNAPQQAKGQPQQRGQTQGKGQPQQQAKFTNNPFAHLLKR
jgi:protein Tex